MRLLLAALFLCLAVPAQAKPSVQPYTFDGDRYVRIAQSAYDVTRAIGCPPPACQRGRVSKSRIKRPKPAPVRNKLAPPSLTLAGGIKREVNSAIASIAGGYMGGNPTGWRSRWCGNFMRLVVRQAGLPDHPTGNLARNWRTYGRAALAQAGSIGVMRSHVGIVIGRCPDGRILLRSGNHGRRVGDGCYAVSRFIAFRVA